MRALTQLKDFFVTTRIDLTTLTAPAQAIATLVLAALVPAILATQSVEAQTFTVLHSFTGRDGAFPSGGLVRDAAGNLYGTTPQGGSHTKCASCGGVVFKLDTAGNETVLHNFGGIGDGAYPRAGLVQDAAGNLYGTTLFGGTSNFGTVFKVDTTGKETVLYSFTGGADGESPFAALLRDAAGNLYGTTVLGGAFTLGTVFKLDATGKETVLYSFAGGTDGANPTAGLVEDELGNLYGTTEGGGSSHSGTVFRLDATGTEIILHTFSGGTDGAYPLAGLVRDAAGNLYGTTIDGGSFMSSGTVFEVDSTGAETVLHSFNRTDGWNPDAGLIRDVVGNLYGTTSQGAPPAGDGTVFKVDKTGVATVLYSFSRLYRTDPYAPIAPLVLDAAGNLYGTTSGGGTFGVGIVFKLTTGNSTTPTTLTSSLNPSTYGQKVTLTATVAPSGSITPTGKVKFTWSIYTIGSATLNSNGVATLTRSNLNADVYPLTAVYGGDANNPPSTSAVLNQVVLETTSSATLTSSPNPSTQGQAVTFTATITSQTVRPTGPVTFTAGKTVLGTAQLSGGKATLTMSSLPAGTNVVTVTYEGDSNIARSTASDSQVVQ
jgi:uncharacterized repeat protein (TIGR03803 family)